MSGENGYYVCFEDKISLDVLIHEVGHVIFDIGSDLGIKYDADNAETFLYLQAYVTRELICLLTPNCSINDILDVKFDLLEDKMIQNNTYEK